MRSMVLSLLICFCFHGNLDFLEAYDHVAFTWCAERTYVGRRGGTHTGVKEGFRVILSVAAWVHGAHLMASSWRFWGCFIAPGCLLRMLSELSIYETWHTSSHWMIIQSPLSMVSWLVLFMIQKKYWTSLQLFEMEFHHENTMKTQGRKIHVLWWHQKTAWIIMNIYNLTLYIPYSSKMHVHMLWYCKNVSGQCSKLHHLYFRH